MLAAVLATTVSIVGPLPVRYELVKDFQPLIAAAAVLAGGTLAYWAAMERISFERRLHESQEAKRQRNLLTKLSYASAIFYGEVEHIKRRAVPGIGKSTGKIKVGDFLLTFPEEFSEAWGSLDILSSEAALALANVRYNFAYLQSALKGLDPLEYWEYRWPTSPPEEIEPAVKTIVDLEKYAEQLLRSLPYPRK